ncbi:M23 family metallopeptidase [Clostridium swellfunianum]|uniref:M23 family metallopeptidase n=1 Tax=Clostridium swellfunianum TaxID=1367462 RepID=UPI00202F3B8B|nr:M23 family metallopeptidase [Clostridium swellfunianum]MCM0649793.1 M23 family metallopeptidase [Clostridium swellfunianum]
MNKKFFSKTSNFFRKEGFYVILFVCLCVVATVAAVTSRTAKPKNPPVVNETAVNDSKTTGTGLITEEPTNDYPNALQVKETPKPNTSANANTGITVPKTGTAAVSKSVDFKFINPVEGTLARAYSEDPVYSDSTDSWRPNFGMDIKAELGKSVVAAADGKVLEVGEGEYGSYVAIYHENGLTTVYANLDKEIKVSKGQSVKKNTQIGKVGNTTLRTGYEKYGSHLHFEVIKGKDVNNDNNKVDPAKYVKYTLAK